MILRTIAFAVICVVTSVNAQTALQEQIENALSPIRRSVGPGAVVMVIRDNEVLAEDAVGMANLEHRVPLKVDSVFHIASDSKQFTAAAVCRLAARGLLDLNDPVAKYIPEMSPLGDQITVLQLLCHSSGLRDQWSLLAMAGWRPEDVVAHDQVVSMLSAQRTTNFKPGERQMYSNSGYTLLAEIVERISGLSFAEFLEREFFAPCGMTRTRARTSIGEVIDDRVESYLSNTDGGFVTRPIQYEVLGATSILSTAKDLARWIRALDDDRAITADEWRIMSQPRLLPDGNPMTYIFGIAPHEFFGFEAVGHGGADGGFRSYVLRVPSERLGVIVLTNTPEIEPNGLAHQIAEWALGISREPDDEEDSGIDEGGEEMPELTAFVGSYRDHQRTVTVRQWFNSVRVWENDESSDFAWRGEDSAFVDPAGRRLRFAAGSCVLIDENAEWTGMRLDAPSAEMLADYEGLYYSSELGAALAVRAHAGGLNATSPRGPAIELQPGGRDFFDGNVWYCGQVRATRAASGLVQDIRLSSSRAFDVVFRRLSTPAEESSH